MNKKTLVIAAALLAAGLVCGSAQELTLSAASSLTDVLTALAPDAEAAVGAKIHLNFGGSGALRRQIEEGAPVDVFFSAAREDMDRLQDARLIVGETRQEVLSNSLVVIGEPSFRPVQRAEDLVPLLAAAPVVAIGNPDSVPAGRYAVEALKKYGLYEGIREKTALGGTVREVLQFVRSGSAPLGIVFLTDALSVKPSASISRVFSFPPDALARPIVYPVAVVASSRSKDKAAKLVDFLQGERARAVYRDAGFLIQ